MIKKSGIYRIMNIVNGKSYVGSAVNVKSRINVHKNLLIKNKHFNNHLQSSWNEYGEKCFIFDIIEIVDIDLLKEKEEFYIKMYKTNDNVFGYNRRIDCTTNLGIKMSQETREKLRISHLGHKRSDETHKKIIESQYESVIQINKKGEKVGTFKSMLEAEEKTGIRRQNISTTCRKKIRSAGGFYWCYEKDFDDFTIPPFRLNYKKK